LLLFVIIYSQHIFTPTQITEQSSRFYLLSPAGFVEIKKGGKQKIGAGCEPFNFWYLRFTFDL